MLATTKHETASTMWPIEEYGKGAGQPYGEPAGPYGLLYYGRGYVQLTWYDNYLKMDGVLKEILTSEPVDLVKYPEQALIPLYATIIMGLGMERGSFRPPNSLDDYFNEARNDAYNARDIINGDKKVVPSWSNGVSIGNLIKGYHEDFLDALRASYREAPPPEPEPEPEPEPLPLVKTTITLTLFSSGPISVEDVRVDVVQQKE
jgi:hypothetical protein